MKVEKILCGENVIRDIESGQITIYNLLDDITAISYPFLIPKFSIYFFCEREDVEDATQSVNLKIFNNESQLFHDKIQINFKDKIRNRAVVKFGGLAIPASGFLIVRISNSADDAILNETKIILSLLQQPPQVKAD